MNKCLLYHKEKPTTWLFVMMLVLGVFIFSGYTSIGPYPRQSTQTELLFSNKYKSSQHCTSYTKASTLTYLYIFFNNGRLHKNNFLSVYNKLIAVSFNSAFNQSYSFKIAVRFFSNKTIPQASDEDLYAYLLG